MRQGGLLKVPILKITERFPFNNFIYRKYPKENLK